MLIEKLVGVASVTGTLVLYILILLSVLSIAVVVDRFLWFRRRRIDAVGMGRKVVERLRANDRAGLITLMKSTPGVEAEVIGEALAWYEDGPEAVEKVLDTGFKERRKDCESYLNFLGTLGNNAPFIGLFGTVLGIVTAFRELANTTAGAGNGMGNVMGGIAEALIATAIGILVAIPAVVAYNVFSKKVYQIEDNIGSIGGLILAHMKSHRGSAVQEGEGEGGGHHKHGKGHGGEVRSARAAEAVA